MRTALRLIYVPKIKALRYLKWMREIKAFADQKRAAAQSEMDQFWKYSQAYEQTLNLEQRDAYIEAMKLCSWNTDHNLRVAREAWDDYEEAYNWFPDWLKKRKSGAHASTRRALFAIELFSVTPKGENLGPANYFGMGTWRRLTVTWTTELEADRIGSLATRLLWPNVAEFGTFRLCKTKPKEIYAP